MSVIDQQLEVLSTMLQESMFDFIVNPCQKNRDKLSAIVIAYCALFEERARVQYE